MFQVGDEVIHVSRYPYGGREDKVTKAIIRKVGRKYVYLEGDWLLQEVPFDKVDGIEHNRTNYSHNLDRIYTPAGWAEKTRRDLVRTNLRNLGIQFNGGYSDPKYSTDALEKLVDLLIEDKAPAPV